MNHRTVVLVAALFGLTAPLFARDKTDVLVMKNGDRMTCEVKGLAGGVLYASFDYIDGTSSVDWTKVAQLVSTQLFVVKTEDGSVYKGTIKTTEAGPGRPVEIEVLEAPEHEELIERSQVVQMVATSDKFWERFNGEISFGTLYSKGNESTQYNLGASAAYVRERWNAGAKYESSLSKSTGVTASTRNQLGLTALHLLPPKNWFYEGIGGFLQSSEQGITLQSLLGGGVGRYLKNTNVLSIQLLGGAAWVNTAYTSSPEPASRQNSATGLVYADVRFFKFSQTNLDANVSLLPFLSDPGRIRVDTNATYYVKLFGQLNWNLSFYGNWDNRPPPGFSGSDYGTSSGLSWSFGLK